MSDNVDILDEFDSILETIACNDPGLSLRAHKLREPLRKTLASHKALVSALGEIRELLSDIWQYSNLKDEAVGDCVVTAGKIEDTIDAAIAQAEKFNACRSGT